MTSSACSDQLRPIPLWQLHDPTFQMYWLQYASWLIVNGVRCSCAWLAACSQHSSAQEVQ
jgi:hypothetical protein